MQIDAIEQRSADLRKIPLDFRSRAAALVRRIAKKSAPAPVQLSTALLNACIGRLGNGRRSAVN
jgi:hypothetical protein